MASELLFRIGIVVTLVMYAGVIVLSAALYVVLEKVNRNLALLAMLLRMAEASVGLGTVLVSFAVSVLLNDAAHSPALPMQQLHAFVSLLLETRAAGLDVLLFLVGLGGTIFAFLFFVSSYVPRALAVWGIFSYSSILVLALVSILVPNSPVILDTVLYALGGAFEVIFGFWLLFKGVDLHARREARC